LTATVRAAQEPDAIGHRDGQVEYHGVFGLGRGGRSAIRAGHAHRFAAADFSKELIITVMWDWAI
jgi:hypothetical protein